MRPSMEYEKVKLHDAEDDTGSETTLLENEVTRPKSIARRCAPWILHSIIILVNFSILIVLIYQMNRPLAEKQKACGPVLERWLPGYADGVEYETQRFVGKFGATSPFTGYGPEVDDAWANITNGGAIGISKEEWEVINEYHDTPVILDNTPELGTGPYLASLDVFHQLHCLDMLRKNIHRDYYNEHAFSFIGQAPEVVETHLEHCVEALRQTLMCNGDLSLLTYNWVASRETPYPNFNSLHTCKKWDKMLAWSLERDVTRGNDKPPMKPAGVVGMWPPP